jgi:hypothetical protein
MEGFNQGGYRRMTNEEAEKLERGQKVIHRRYGVCIVQQVLITEALPCGELFGVVIRPANQNGRALLRQDCQSDVPDVLEERARNFSNWKPPVKPGYKPIDHETAWGISEEDMPPQELKNHFAPNDEGVLE